MDDVARNPELAARALARVLDLEADRLGSFELATFAPAVTRVRAAARGLTESFEERGWGARVVYGLGDAEETAANAGCEHCACEDDGEENDGEEIDEAEIDGEEIDEEEEETSTPAGRKFTYQARFDFVVFDERALEQRLVERYRELGTDTSLEDMSVVPDEHLNLLLFLDNPTNRNYSAAGVYIAHGEEFFAEIDRTLDEFDYDTQADAYPATM